jgi:hypothetical protein
MKGVHMPSHEQKLTRTSQRKRAQRDADTPTINLEAKLAALADMRTQFRATVVLPLQQAMRTQGALDSALQVDQIPVEAAAAGFEVNVFQQGDEWHVTIARQIDGETTFHASANASSLRAALFQVADRGNEWISHTEANARTAAAKAKVRKAEA